MTVKRCFWVLNLFPRKNLSGTHGESPISGELICHEQPRRDKKVHQAGGTPVVSGETRNDGLLPEKGRKGDTVRNVDRPD